MSDDKTYATRLNTNSTTPEVDESVRIELFFEKRLIVITRDELPYYIGRDNSACDMIVDGDTISRKHCVLQWRDGQIGLLDTSTNGTFVKPGRAGSVLIHNDFYPLVGQGCLKLGQRLSSEDDPDVVFYKVVSH